MSALPSLGSEDGTRRALRAARLPIAPAVYVARSFLWAALAAAALLAIGSAWVLWRPSPSRTGDWLLVAAAALVAFGLVRLGFLLYPRVIASSRRSAIDAELPSVVLLAYALSRGGVSAIDVFRVVASERAVCGEISREAALVVRDVDQLGMDINAALDDLAATTPSPALAAFVKGLVTVLVSGAAPEDHFRRQAELQLSIAELGLNKELEQASLMGELYVSGLLVLPLLLLVVVSVLAALGSGGEVFVPYIVYGFIPVATLAYLGLIVVLLPSPRVMPPPRRGKRAADFGMEGMGESAAGPIADEAPARGISASLARGVAAALARPVRAGYASGVLAALIASGCAMVVTMRPGLVGEPPAMAGMLALVTMGAVVPIAVFHEIKTARAREFDAAIPGTLSRLAGSNERGISLVQAIEILGRSDAGPLAVELRRVSRDIAWNRSLRAALGRLPDRVPTARMARVAAVLRHASAATGDMREVLDITAREGAVTEDVTARKRVAMMNYVVVIYVVFGVFLYVLYMVASLFFGQGGLTGVGPDAKGLEPAQARTLFFHASLLQGACSGLVAGRLGEGSLLSGIKHACILGILAWAVFAVGVF